MADNSVQQFWSDNGLSELLEHHAKWNLDYPWHDDEEDYFRRPGDEQELVQVRRAAIKAGEVADILRRELMSRSRAKARQFERDFRMLLDSAGGAPFVISQVLDVFRDHLDSADIANEGAVDIKPIQWLGTQRQLVYWIKELVAVNLISPSNLWKLTSHHFVDQDGKSLKPGTLASEANAIGAREKDEGKKPRGAEDIDRILSDMPED